MPGEAFPTLGHPPRCILMGGEYPEKPSDGYFPQLWHWEFTDGKARNNGLSPDTDPKQWVQPRCWSETMDHIDGLGSHIYKYGKGEEDKYILRTRHKKYKSWVC